MFFSFFLFLFLFSFLVSSTVFVWSLLLIVASPSPLLGWVVSPPLLVGGSPPSCQLGGLQTRPFLVAGLPSPFLVGPCPLPSWFGLSPLSLLVLRSPFPFSVGSSLLPCWLEVPLPLVCWCFSPLAPFSFWGSPFRFLVGRSPIPSWLPPPPLLVGGPPPLSSSSFFGPLLLGVTSPRGCFAVSPFLLVWGGVGGGGRRGAPPPHTLLGWAVTFRLFDWMVSPLPSWLGGLPSPPFLVGRSSLRLLGWDVSLFLVCWKEKKKKGKKKRRKEKRKKKGKKKLKKSETTRKNREKKEEHIERNKGKKRKEKRRRKKKLLLKVADSRINPKGPPLHTHKHTHAHKHTLGSVTHVVRTHKHVTRLPQSVSLASQRFRYGSVRAVSEALCPRRLSFLLSQSPLTLTWGSSRPCFSSQECKEENICWRSQWTTTLDLKGQIVLIIAALMHSTVF